jgi:hypothetical protein
LKTYCCFRRMLVMAVSRFGNTELSWTCLFYENFIEAA